MAHSINYEPKYQVLNFIPESDRKLVRNLTSKSVVTLKDATAAQARQMVFAQIADFGIEDESALVISMAVRKGVLRYCKMIQKFELTMEEAYRMVRICLMAINWHKMNNEASPLRLTDNDIKQASDRFNLIYED